MNNFSFLRFFFLYFCPYFNYHTKTLTLNHPSHKSQPLH